MIPDIALMIVVYGIGRLAVAVLEPHRGTSGTWPQTANALAWLAGVGAALILVLLALDVLSIASSASSTVPGLTTR